MTQPPQFPPPPPVPGLPATVDPPPAGVPLPPRPVTPPRARTPAAAPAAPGARKLRRLRRQRRRRRIRIGLAALVAVAVAVTAVITTGHGHQRRGPAVTTGRTQHTLLLGIGPSGGAAQSAALFAVDPTRHSGGTLLIPPDTLVDGPGGTVGGSYAITPAAEFAGSVSDLLGVHIDDTWRLTPAGLAQLVSELGGVTVDVDTTIATPALNVVAGSQQLSGAQAAAYALYGADTEQARANRTRLVFDAILSRLPAQSQVAALLGALGPASTSTGGTDALAASLTQLAASDDASNEEVLPTNTLDTGSTTPSFALDTTSALPIVTGLFGGSLLASTGAAGTRVEVVNDSGRPDLATGARSQLSAAGLTFVRAVNDQPFHQYKRSSVLVFTASAASIAFGHRVAAALGIPTAPVLVSSQTTSVADALAVLATDYVSPTG